MAGGGGTVPSSGRRKSLDAEVNLVPFIDLLSMCICFLLMTAVWMEVGGVNVKQLMGTDAPADAKDSLEMDVKYLGPQTLELNLKRQGKSSAVYKIDGPTNEERLTKLRETVKAFASSVSVARITTKAGISYGEVITVMDALRESGIVSLGLVPVKD